MKFIMHFVTIATAVASTKDGLGSKSPTEMANLKTRHFKTKREMAAKKLHLQSSNPLRSFKPSFMEQSVQCDWYNEETCYDENYDAVSCALYKHGGCPCPAGQQRCGQNLPVKELGYCATLCCGENEESCYDAEYNVDSCASYDDGGCPCPEGQQKCEADGYNYWTGYCSAVCCDYATEETCYDADYNAVSCALYEEGGCPCGKGEVKCGVDEYYYYGGYCTTICCEAGEETCYDDSGIASYCAPISTGGCPCPEGQEKCGSDEYYAGYCTSECCDAATQETCYDYYGTPESCAAISDGGCPCPEGQVKCEVNTTVGYESAGYCTEVCCDYATEELCYSDAESWYPKPTSCAKIADGGCPCPEGQVKCGGGEYYAGYCTALCCDSSTEETCYDENYIEQSCALISDGGCPCPEGQDKCGGNEYWAGSCTTLCCGSDEETCYDENYPYAEESCAKIADGGCPCAEGEVKCGANTTIGYEYAGFCTPLCCEEQTCYDYSTWTPTSCAAYEETCPFEFMYDAQKAKTLAMLKDSNSARTVAKIREIKAIKVDLISQEIFDLEVVEQIMKANEAAIFRKALNAKPKVFDNSVPAFMAKVY